MGSVDSSKLRASDFDLGDDYGISNPVTRAAIQKSFVESLPAEIDEKDLNQYPMQFDSLVRSVMDETELDRNRADTENKLVEYQNKQNSANLNNRRSTMARKTAFDDMFEKEIIGLDDEIRKIDLSDTEDKMQKYKPADKPVAKPAVKEEEKTAKAKCGSAQLSFNSYLKKVAATAVVIERKTAAPDPRKMKRLMMLLGGLAGAGGIAAGVNSARPGMMEEYWGNAGDELVGNPTQASVMEDDSQNAANLADTEAMLMGEYAGAATDVARNNAKSQKQKAYEQALAAYGDVNNIPFEVLQDIDAQYQQNVDSGNRKYNPINAVAPKGTGKGSGIMGADLTDFDKLMAEGGYN